MPLTWQNRFTVKFYRLHNMASDVKIYANMESSIFYLDPDNPDVDKMK